MRWILAIFLFGGGANAAELSGDQQLIVACYRLDVERVIVAIQNGANVNARFGDGDDSSFQDPWDLGQPVAVKAWTPLIATASASSYPEPPRKIRNSLKDLKWAADQKQKITDDQLVERKKSAQIITSILLSHRANVNEDDGFGATALYLAIKEQKTDMALLLLHFGANVNTKTSVYIDGTGDITPLHQAYWSAPLTKLLLEKGASPKAEDTEGRSPLDWAREFGGKETSRLYEMSKDIPGSEERSVEVQTVPKVDRPKNDEVKPQRTK